MNESSIDYKKVEPLKPGLKELSMIVKLVDVGLQRVVSSRRDRGEHRVTEALVGDETGTILLTLWDDQIDRLNIGDVLEIKNGYTSLFKGSLRLNIGRYGTINKIDKTIDVNTKNNLSEERHEVTPWYKPTGRPFRRRRRR